MANQRTTNKTTPPKTNYKSYTSTTGTKTGVVSNSKGTKTTVVKSASGGKKVRVTDASGKLLGYKEFDSSGKDITTKKPVPVKSTEVKATTPKKLTTEQTDKIPFKNDAINKFSDKVYPIYQTPTAKNRREDTPNFAADAANNRKPFKEQEIMYGTKAQRDSSMASVYKRNIKNFSGTNLLVYPDKNNPYVAPGNTGAGPLVRRKFVTNNAQLRANKRLTGKTGDQ